MNKEQPRIKIEKTRNDLLLERIGMLLLATLWIYSAYWYGKLPSIVPVHFNFSGDADRYGNKAIFLLLPAIITIIFAGLYWLNKHPHRFNYIGKVTVENAERQYRLASRMIRVLSLIIIVAFGFITVKTVRAVPGQRTTLEWWFIPALLISLLGTTFYYVYRSARANR